VSKGSEAFSQVIRNPLGGVKQAEITNMTRQLATLVKAHVPIVESLSALIEQIEYPKLKKILIAVRQSVNEGRSLADGFAAFPKVFDRVYVNMVRAGESAGRLDVVLLRLADFAENRGKLKQKVGGALTYPIIMVIVGFGVLGVIFVKVVPQITSIFTDMKQQLPTPTKILIAVSNVAQAQYPVILVGILVIALLIERYIKTTTGRRRKDEIFLRLPIVSALTRNIAVARFARTLGTLLSSGVPMITALQITRNVVANAVFEEVVESAETLVSEGRSLAYTLKQSRQFPPIVVHMVGVGEKTGELEAMLANVADNYEQQVDALLGTLTSLLEPLMMVMMALLVGFIVMAVLMPIFQMNSFG
jgi:general secretion pathway protein F